MALSDLVLSMAHYTRRLAAMYGDKIPRPDKAWSARERYQMLDGYYASNGVYVELAEALYLAGVHTHAIAEIRNPTQAAVEFYPAKLWPGPLETALQIRPDEAAADKSDALTAAINRIWEWSNWGSKKQLAARWLALHGDLFLQASTKAKVVGKDAQGNPKKETIGAYIQIIPAKEVSDFKVDERGFITYLRHDVGHADEHNETVFTTTLWSKEFGGVKTWTHRKAINTDIKRLGEPDTFKTFAEMKIDFIPFVHCPFRDIGPEDGVPRGMPLIWPALTKIDNCNRNATRLNQLLFRHGKPTNALKSNAFDSTGRPIAVSLDLPTDEDGKKQWGDDDVLNLPGSTELQQLVPNINYAAHAEQVRDDLRAIEMDLPELAYQRIMEKGEMSGTALTRVFDVVISRAIEARGNAYPALRRATQMALSIAQAGGVQGFDKGSIGTFDAGTFGFSFIGQDIIPLTDAERGATAQVFVNMGVPVDMALERYAGYSEEDAAKVAASRAEQQAQALATTAAQPVTLPAYKNADPIARAKQRVAATDKAVAKAETALGDDAVAAKTERPEPPASAIQRAIDAVKRRTE